LQFAGIVTGMAFMLFRVGSWMYSTWVAAEEGEEAALATPSPVPAGEACWGSLQPKQESAIRIKPSLARITMVAPN
jgi:hypothetical protein